MPIFAFLFFLELTFFLMKTLVFLLTFGAEKSQKVFVKICVAISWNFAKTGSEFFI